MTYSTAPKYVRGNLVAVYCLDSEGNKLAWISPKDGLIRACGDYWDVRVAISAGRRLPKEIRSMLKQTLPS